MEPIISTTGGLIAILFLILILIWERTKKRIIPAYHWFIRDLSSASRHRRDQENRYTYRKNIPINKIHKFYSLYDEAQSNGIYDEYLLFEWVMNEFCENQNKVGIVVEYDVSVISKPFVIIREAT